MGHASEVVDITIGVVALLLIAAAVRGTTKKGSFPFSVALTLAGMALTWLATHFEPAAALVSGFTVTPQVILYVFLPTLVFESSFNLDARLLRDNLTATLTLAAPGLILSTAIIGAMVHAATAIPLAEALLLGAILSATDPVAVIALFKQLGVSRRLMILVEGESLLNDATAIVLARILVGVVAAGGFSLSGAASGAADFVLVFAGGVVVGWVMAILAAWALSAVESDPFIETTITVTLAYGAFLAAEELFHVSGVMASMAAGLVLGGRRRVTISAVVRDRLEHLWEYLAFVANALIFLLVGLHVRLESLAGSAGALAWVIAAMLVSRAVVVYGLTPLPQRAPGAEPVSVAYQTVMFWGGLRGAIALAIVMSLPGFERHELFITLVTGAVLFTLVVQGLTMNRLVALLGLNTAPFADRVALLEARLAAAARARDRIPELSSHGFFSGAVGGRLAQDSEREIAGIQAKLDALRRAEMDPGTERRLLLMFALSEEKAMYHDLFSRGHLSEPALYELILSVDLQLDALRRPRPDARPLDYHHLRRRELSRRAVRLLDQIPWLDPLTRRLHQARIAHDYEVAWGRGMGDARVMEELAAYASLRSFSGEALGEVRALYEKWRDASTMRLDGDAREIPEFVIAAQERLGKRLALLAKLETVREQATHGAIPHGVAEILEEELLLSLRSLRGIEPASLAVGPVESLRRTPLFSGLSPGELTALANHVRERLFAEKEIIVRQGDQGSSMFLIARGVARVSREINGVRKDVATLMTGDFFGEMALLHAEPRSATVWAVTPCSVGELLREDALKIFETHPDIGRAVRLADAERRRSA